MNQVIEAAQTVEAKQAIDLQKTIEKFDVVSITNNNNQFNITVTNRGDIPVHLTRLWVENTTDNLWSASKYDLDIAIPSGGSVTNIGQNLGLTALDSQSYLMKLVTERGNTQKIFLDSVSADSLYLSLSATPTIVPTTFSATLVLKIINTGSNTLINLQPEMDSVITLCTLLCSATIVSGPTPANFDSLEPGNIAIFEWVYTIDGEDTGDSVTFTASLVNGVDEDTAVVTVQPILNAENANVSLITGQYGGVVAITSDILLFHLEQGLVPSPGYQMMSGSVDGGTSGLLFNMETQTVGSAVAFLTNNGTDTVTIPAGNWVASLALRSEAVATGIQDQDVDMIFHMEDGDGVNPDNSEGSFSRDLASCGSTAPGSFQERIQARTNDAEQRANGEVKDDEEKIHLAYKDNFRWNGLRWSLDVPPGAIITAADIRFKSENDETGGSPNLIIGAEYTVNAAAFVESSNNISNRWDGTTNTVTTAQVTWTSIPGWSNNEEGADTTTPDLKDIVQEIVDIGSWSSGNNIVFIIKDNSGGTDFDLRKGISYDDSSSEAPRLTVTWIGSGGNPPTWEALSGPHGSGSHKYDGVNDCFQSLYYVSSGDENHLKDQLTTTSLWFRTDGTNVSSEQMLFFWEGEDAGGGGYPTSDYYKLSLGSENDGRLLFEFDVEKGTQTSTCLSTLEYDDENWHHAVAVRYITNDKCELYITNLDGTNPESVITHSPDNALQELNQDATDRWYVGSQQDAGNYFKGWIDDVMHWNGDALNTFEAPDLARTNYGTGAHKLDVSIDRTDTTGVFETNLYSSSASLISFQDNKGQDDTTDAAYTMFNVTMSMPETIITPLQRLNFSLAFIPSTSTWEALELDMKIDDTGFSPFSSYLQIPPPDNPFNSYIVYDNDDELEIFVNNIGIDGVYYIYAGTRVSFYGDSGVSYASLIHYINGTNATYEVDIDKDSIYISPGESAKMYFFDRPTDHPCQGSGSSCQEANIIPPGNYRIAAWVNGYSDQGETFGRSMVLGNIEVVE